jgi:hypothetical protein
VNIPLEERLLLMQKVSEYAWAADLGEFEKFADLFTPDGVLEAVIPGTSEPFAPGGHVKHFAGREALIAYGRANGPEVFGIPRTQALHHQTNFVVEEYTGTTARTKNYMIATIQVSPPEVQDEKGPITFMHGVYYDEWEKIDGEWLFALRSYRPAGYHSSYFESHATPPAPGV